VINQAAESSKTPSGVPCRATTSRSRSSAARFVSSSRSWVSPRTIRHPAHERPRVIGVDTQSDRLVDRRDVDVGEMSGVENGLHPFGIGEAEGPWSVRRGRRQRPPHGQRAADGDEPLVVLERLPCKDREAASAGQSAMDVGEGGDRVVEEHGAEGADGHVERARCERVDLGIGLDELDVAQPLLAGTLSGVGEHPRRQVDADGRPRRCHSSRIPGGPTRAAADVEHPVRRLEQPGEIQMLRHPFGARLVAVGPCGPFVAFLAVPGCSHLRVRDRRHPRRAFPL
jgi:hypothetical protein